MKLVIGIVKNRLLIKCMGVGFAAGSLAEVGVRDRSWIKVDSYKEVMEFRRVEECD